MRTLILLGAFAYGLPLTMMDVTREVITAVEQAGEYTAPPPVDGNDGETA